MVKLNSKKNQKKVEKRAKNVNHRPQLEKVKRTFKKNKSKKVEQSQKKSKVWLLVLADYWSQEKSKTVEQ